MRTAHSAPMIRNGPNGTYDLRPTRRVTRSTSRTTPARIRPKIVPPSALAPEHEAHADEQLHVPRPKAPAPNGMEGRYSTAGISTAASTAGSNRSPTSGFKPLIA